MAGITRMGEELEVFVEKAIPGSVNAEKIGLKHICDVVWNDILIECKDRNRNQVRPFKGCIEVHRNDEGLFVIPPDYNLFVGSHKAGQHNPIGAICFNGGFVYDERMRVDVDTLKDRIKTEWDRCLQDKVFQRKLTQAKGLKEKIEQLQRDFNNDEEYQRAINESRLLGPTWNPKTRFRRVNFS